VLLGRGRLGTSYEPGTDPDTLGTVHERCGKTSSVVDTTGSDDVDLRLSMEDTNASK
jgi:hypothetical protein